MGMPMAKPAWAAPLVGRRPLTPRARAAPRRATVGARRRGRIILIWMTPVARLLFQGGRLWLLSLWGMDTIALGEIRSATEVDHSNLFTRA